MADRIFVAAAWPYANSSLHLGHIAGCYLPADIFARYHRMRGNQVLMVSGSDQHGTPITVRAEEEGVPPQTIVERYHGQSLETWRRLGITFDLYTTTGTENHRQTVHEIFLRLYEQGLIYKKTAALPYSTKAQRFLPDRYVEGTCPFCGYSAARGDQCDQCGKQLDPKDLINIKSKLHGDTPEFRETEHFFLKLSAFEQELAAWIGEKAHWRPNVRNFVAQYLKDGLIDRAITRDLDWGVTIPLPGYESKRIYVWFEAVIGYLSASKEWAQRQGQPEAWREFWQGDVRSYYFLGKDNIPFHAIIWPAILRGYDRTLAQPYDIPANEYLNLEGLKFSKSRNWAVYVHDFLDRFEADPLRYTLSINMPETADTDFSWKEFLRRNNDELVATYGNLVNRVLSFTYRTFEGKVPEHTPEDRLGESSRGLLRQAEATLEETARCLEACRFKEGIKAAMNLAREANRYLEEQQPWKTVKTDRQAAADALWTGSCVVAALKTALYPYMPVSSQKVHEYLGQAGRVEEQGWALARPVAGRALRQPAPLFAKLDEAAVTAEMTGAQA
ncbi:MAG: methionine--tRNA ligase [Dehalococcoidia bacterium]|nr:methionine--tRNA ligase [Dehalococcoidia bacterium]